ncbi:hypothetical protein GCM10018787_43850 [Streptomyces thermodiastaticus]|nr:hypothetical protein GCM10018787_43850 [Streptomyces thermodiastaticus]
MTQHVVVLTQRMPDTQSLLAALYAGGPNLRVSRAGQGALVYLRTEDGRQVASVEAPRFIQVAGEATRLLAPAVETQLPLWWTEVRASTAVPEAQRLAASIAGRLAALLDGVTWPSEAAAHTEVVTLPAAGTHPSPGDGDGVLAEADVLTDQSAVILYDIPVLAVTTWLTELLRTPEQTGRHLYLVTPSTARLTLAARTVLDRAAARWVIRDPEAGYYDGLSGMVLSWRDGHFTPVTDPSPTVAEAFRPPAGGAVGERQLLLSLRTIHPADEHLLLGGALECAWQTLTGEPPAVWSTAEPVNVPWSRRQLTDLARTRARCGTPTWLVAIGSPGQPGIATQQVQHTRLGVEEHITLAFGYTADRPAPLDRLPHLAEELAAHHNLATMVTEVRAARADLTVPAHYEPPALPVSLTLGPDAVADFGLNRANAALPDAPPLRLGSKARPALYYQLGDGDEPVAWRRLQALMRCLDSPA